MMTTGAYDRSVAVYNRYVQKHMLVLKDPTHILLNMHLCTQYVLIFDDQETFMIIISVENSCASVSYFHGNRDIAFSGIFNE